jgi:hypothetical protein
MICSVNGCLCTSLAKAITLFLPSFKVIGLENPAKFKTAINSDILTCMEAESNSDPYKWIGVIP